MTLQESESKLELQTCSNLIILNHDKWCIKFPKQRLRATYDHLPYFPTIPAFFVRLVCIKEIHS